MADQSHYVITKGKETAKRQEYFFRYKNPDSETSRRMNEQNNGQGWQRVYSKMICIGGPLNGLVKTSVDIDLLNAPYAIYNRADWTKNPKIPRTILAYVGD